MILKGLLESMFKKTELHLYVVFKELDKMLIMFCFNINHKMLPYDWYKKITLKIVTNHDLIMLSLSVKKSPENSK